LSLGFRLNDGVLQLVPADTDGAALLKNADATTLQFLIGLAVTEAVRKQDKQQIFTTHSTQREGS
jgi:hypothetical protein